MTVSASAPTNPMKATWHQRPRSEWTFFERTLVDLGILQDAAGSERPPVHAKTEPVGVFPVWRQHLFIIPRAVLPLLIHAVFTHYTAIEVPRLVAGVIYLAYFVWYGSHLFQWCALMTKRHGTFDGQVQRDGIPDIETKRVAVGLTKVVALRIVFGFAFIYDGKTFLPSWWLPLQLFAYACVLDFWFYWYHRAMHEVSWLWRFHRKHHTTKHPNAALGAFADDEQELFDILVIPILTWLVVPVDFGTWFIAMTYQLYIEAAGHSGVRGVFQNPTTFPLAWFGCELVLEDHDIHHRQGWKKSGNYGKQTRLWDTLFGTKKPRIEGVPENIDWNKKLI